ncbi:MAG TPA: putative metal-dependent hydrolase [bacterium]|jgi:uncharacterized damage-inducible protein DinB
MKDPRYPLGKFAPPQVMTPSLRQEMINTIAATPEQIGAAVQGLSDAQLDTPYREGGWTVRQVVHHLPDSHLNAYTRFKLALTEDSPMVKPYDEAAWAMLPDSVSTPIHTSLCFLECLHERWVHVLRAMAESDFARGYRHPDFEGVRSLDFLLAIYAWHGPHHVAHVTELRKRMGW